MAKVPRALQPSSPLSTPAIGSLGAEVGSPRYTCAVRRPGESERPAAGSPAPRGEGFRARAQVEADRYGPDAWIFIRELLQNARDAGATRVTFEAEDNADSTVLRCRDDGEGMSFEHARSYLFALYASSKESRRDQVGRFGVGFWSILRYEPTRIVIRSRPKVGEAWEIEFDGDLEHAIRRTPTMERGTELVLERAAGDGAIARRVWDAARQNARFLTRRDDHSAPLPVTVNGEPINAPFALPAPSAAFRRAGLRGVVGLGNAARVELFSRGLRVRSAATLDDFLSGRGRHTSRSRVHFAELPARLAPQAILEGERLEVLLSRADARENRSLRRLVRLAQRELQRLINRQLDAARPLPWWRRWPQSLRLLLRNSLAMRTGLAAMLGALLALVISVALWGDRLGAHLGNSDLRAVVAGEAPRVRAIVPTGGVYSDLAAHYLGPQIDDLRGSGEPVDLHYSPAELELSFAALIIDRFDSDEVPSADLPEHPTSYVGVDCAGGEGCVRVELGVHFGPGLSRVPVPTGHRLDPSSVRLGDAPVEIVASQHDQPLVVIDSAVRGVLSYATAPAAPATAAVRPHRSPALPGAIAAEARSLRRRPPRERIERLTELVSERVRYTTDPEVAARLEARRLAGEPLFARTLAVGRGDCDVQNALLVALLQEAGVPARLAIGYVGRGGKSTPWHHAWAEFRLGSGPWESADASANSAPPALQVSMADGAGSAGEVGGTPSGVTAAGESGGAGEVGDGPPQAASGESGEVEGEPVSGDLGPSTSEGASTQGDPSRAPAVAGAAGRPSTASPGGVVSRLPAVFIFGALGSLLLLLLLLLRRTRRTVALEPSTDLSELLQGVLQHPESFRALPAVFQRPLIPVAGGPALSIEEAREMASEGRLFRTRVRSKLAEEAIRSRTRVLDENVPEARTVADALGAIDLDVWERLLGSGESSPLLSAVNRHLEQIGEPWWVVVAEAPRGGARTLDLGRLGLRRHPLRGRRVIVIDSGDPWLAEAIVAYAEQPKAALFAALDRIAETIDLPDARRARLLLVGARELIAEVAAGPGREGER